MLTERKDVCLLLTYSQGQPYPSSHLQHPGPCLSDAIRCILGSMAVDYPPIFQQKFAKPLDKEYPS